MKYTLGTTPHPSENLPVLSTTRQFFLTYTCSKNLPKKCLWIYDGFSKDMGIKSGFTKYLKVRRFVFPINISHILITTLPQPLRVWV